MFDPYAHLDFAGRQAPSGHPVYFENPNSLEFFLSPYVNTASPFTSPKTDGKSTCPSEKRAACQGPWITDHSITDRFETRPYWSNSVVGVIK